MAKYKCSGRNRLTDDGEAFCLYEANKRWLGRCPGCGRFYDIVKTGANKSTKATLATLGTIKPKKRISTGIDGVDLVLGGEEATGRGIVKGSSIFISGEPGLGKSTLLLTVANNVAATHKKGVVYASGEQSVDDIAMVSQRIGATHPNVRVIGNEGDIYKITEECEVNKPELLVVDSLQTAHCPDSKAEEGSSEQCKAVTNYLTAWCKRENVAAIIVCHVDKEGNLAGPKSAEHLVDVVLEFDPAVDAEKTPIVFGTDDDKKKLAKLTSMSKNRFGATGVEAYLLVTKEGIKAGEKPAEDDGPPRRGHIITPEEDAQRPKMGTIDFLAEFRKRIKTDEENKE